MYYGIFLGALKYNMVCKMGECIKELSPNMIEKTKKNNIKKK